MGKGKERGREGGTESGPHRGVILIKCLKQTWLLCLEAEEPLHLLSVCVCVCGGGLFVCVCVCVRERGRETGVGWGQTRRVVVKVQEH